VLGVLLLQYFSTSYSEVETIPYSQFEQLLNADRIAEVTVKTDSIEGRLVDPLPSGATRPSPNRSQCEVLGLACGLAMIIGHNIWSGGALSCPHCLQGPLAIETWVVACGESASSAAPRIAISQPNRVMTTGTVDSMVASVWLTSQSEPWLANCAACC